jgi:phosphoribosylanthranilate isomerase
MTFVKICGITNLEDALCAVDAGADLLGFILYPPSPRSVSVEAAKEIVREVRRQATDDGRLTTIRRPSSIVTCVGVFVKETPAHMLRVLAGAGLDAAQMHGNPPDDLREMQGRAYIAVKDWKLEIGDSTSRRSPISNPQSLLSNLPDLLLDANHPTLWGGSGPRADESLLAGGLTPDNVADAIRAVQPWGVDVASGTEAAPGKKDHAKVRAFIANAKQPQ